MRQHTVMWKRSDDMVLMKVRDLIRDDTLYPRESIDPAHVQRMIDASACGVEFPPAIVCRKTKRIVDGRHRVTMVEKIKGPDGEVACVLKSYRSDEEFFLDAVRYNSEHGLTLNGADRMRVLEIGDRLKISVTKTAGALRMSVHAAGKFTPIRISVPAVREPSSIKINPRFATVAPSNPAPTFLPIIGSLDRVIHWLEEDVAVSDERIAKRLDLLRQLLEIREPAIQR